MRNLIADHSFDFLGKRRFAAIISVALVVLSLVLIVSRGLNYGVDFTGGYTIEVGYEQAPDLNGIRDALAAADLSDAVVQAFGSSTDVLIRLAPREGITSATLGDEILQLLSADTEGRVEMRRVEFVGPQVGEELREKGGLAILSALAAIILYIWIRFEKKFSVGSVLALVHDVVITVGVFALFQFEFDLTVLAAVLAVIGYSLNDTIVVFDRIRENFITLRSGKPIDVMNLSINQTLTRTVITSCTTLFVVLALLLFGGQIIQSFSIALLVGIVVGTYSSIFVASAAVLELGVTKEDLMPVEKEGADSDLDARP
ncbi:MAG: protein translocase subunit SecF [Gammaproteobacteria bacterium]|nr:MAG: protein translocase subunit SecF [Gammaproteobacteria bacterium]